MTLDIKMPIDKTAVSFEVPESAIGLSIEFSSDKLSSMNFLVYDEDEKLRGQHMGYSNEGSIWLGLFLPVRPPHISLGMVKD